MKLDIDKINAITDINELKVLIYDKAEESELAQATINVARQRINKLEDEAGGARGSKALITRS